MPVSKFFNLVQCVGMIAVSLTSTCPISPTIHHSFLLSLLGVYDFEES